MTQGWLFDAYPRQGRMVCWIWRDDGAARLEDSWSPSIYAAGDRADLEAITDNREVMQLVNDCRFVRRRERITDHEKSAVLKLAIPDASKMAAMARHIERLGRFGRYRLYNVDVPPAQSYFYQHDLFSLAHCSVCQNGSQLAWTLQDDVWSTDYMVPEFKKLRLDANIRKQGRLPKFADRLDSVILKVNEEKAYEIGGASEAGVLAALESEVARLDPDLVITYGGDSFLFPYLAGRAEQNGVSLSLSRERVPLAKPARDGTSYFSYGKIHFKPAATRLHGRVHVDMHNSFVWGEAGMDGLYEVARTCRMPLHTAARASIGKCMSSLQFYHATKNGLLVPWKPVIAEHFKTYEELLVADRGGFVFEPEAGAYEQVAELDFASLYANIMMKKNLSAETVGCDCCPDSKERVPELGYNICERRPGIVPISLEILIKKRAEYKIKRNAASGGERKAFDDRQNALKWILVTSFGYLGFNNAKFGRIDAHIAVCAFDRHVFLQASRIAERLGFRVLHGIVDSLWVQKRNATASDYLELKSAIEQETGFEISFEGVYKWIAFVHSKQSKKLPVANRYFGAFEDGSLKIRGIEARRHDTPTFFEKFQLAALQIMARGNTVAEVKALMPEVQDVFDRHAGLLQEGKAPIRELVFTKQTSKDAGQHSGRKTVENDALGRLAQEGRPLKAGQTFRYVISEYGRRSRKAIPDEMIGGNTAYDSARYVELLAQVCNSVTEPFGYRVG